jgi:hypothetical protein
LVGSIIVTNILEDKMKKVFTLSILLALSLFLCNCGGGSGSSNSPKGENRGMPSVVQLLPSHFVAQTNSVITLHARVLDGNGAPVTNIPVSFTNLSPVGLLSAFSANTNSTGIASVTIKSTTSGFSTVQIEVNAGVSQVRDRRTVFFSPFSTSQAIPSLVLTADNYVLFENDNDNEAIVTATVFDGFGQRAVGMNVLFGSDSEEVTFPLGNLVMADQNGQASALIRVIPSTLRNLPTVLNITALADNQAFNILSLTLNPVSIDQVDVFANPQTVESGGTSAITARVTTTAGTPAPDGTTVNFTASRGGIDPFSQTTDGIAEVEFTAPEVTSTATASIFAIVGDKSDSIFVTITAPVTPPTPTPLSVTPPTTNICETSSSCAGGTVTTDRATFTISGGTGPYTVVSSNTAVILSPGALPSGTNSFEVNAVNGSITANQDVTLTVTDSAATPATDTAVVTVINE